MLPVSALRRLLACLASAALLATPAAARAQAPEISSDARESERTALYNEGVSLANAGRWDEAVVRFRQVVAIRTAPPALFTLAQAEEHLGRLATAERTYESALRDARASGNAAVAEAATKALAALEPRVPRIVVRLAAPLASGASATIDGTSVALDEATWIDPGEHVVAVRAPDRRPFESHVFVKPGATSEVSARLEAAADQPAATPTPASPPATTSHPATSPQEPPTAEAQPEPPEAPSPHRSLPVAQLLLAGGGVAAIAVGLVVRLQAQSSYDDASSHCPAGCPSQAFVDQGNSARTNMIVGTIAVGAGALVVAGAGVWWLTAAPTRDGGSATLTARF